MAGVRRKGNNKSSWQGFYYIDGEKFSVYLKKADFPAYRNALKECRRLEAIGQKPMSKNWVVKEYLEDFINKKSIAIGTVKRFSDHARNFCRFLEKKHPDAFMHKVTADMVEEFKKWMQDNNYSSSSTNGALRLLREAWEKAKDKQIIPKNVFKEVSYLKEVKRQKRPPSKEEVLRMIYWFKENAYIHLLIVYFLATQGWRRKDIVTLKMKDIDLKNKRLYLFIHKAKEEDYIKLGERQCEVINEHILYLKRKRLYKEDGFLFPSKSKKCKSGHVGIDQTRKLMKRGMKELDIKTNFYPHIFRHYVVTLLKAAGVSSINIAETTGHRSTRTIDENYAHPDSEVVKKNREILELDIGLSPKSSD
ncbi:MAG: tyrosine-type recombinase/integrase [Candidatus Omnitrophica bacterium]|nr:tyrosine-type recombinase/integrase [Candidatus Omnitrophota bacterium]